MVCSSTLIAMAVIHSAKWWKPRRVKAQAKALSRACQIDQVSLASVMMRLLCRGQLGLGPPGRFRPGDVAFQYGTPAQLLWSFSWKLLPRRTRKNLKPETRPQYPLKALALREKKTYVIEPPSFPTTPIEVFVDFEGLPDERFVYLVGMIVLQDGSERRESLWADSPGDADRLMQDFLASLAGLGNFTMYHYGSFEARALRAFDKRTGHVFSQQVTSVINRSFNILPLLSMNVYPPTYTNELKDVASFLGFHWSDEGMTGAKSIVLRQNWALSGDPRHKDALVRYNIDDCAALRVIKEWLCKLEQTLPWPPKTVPKSGW